MTRRTTGLAETFALMCVVHVAAAQSYPRPRAGVVVAAPRAQVVRSGWVGTTERAAVRPHNGGNARIGLIAAAPARPQGQVWGGAQNQGVSSWPAAQYNSRMNPRPARSFPSQIWSQPMEPGSVQAAPRGASTARGNKPRIGLVVPGPPAAQDQFSSTVFPRVQSAGFVQVAQFYYLPAVVLTDGRILANFNGRYEEVLRRCAAFSGPLPPNFTTSACWMIDSYGRYVVAQPR
jgi:hypothetical protein